jgi:error-prone DNA polymerase
MGWDNPRIPWRELKNRMTWGSQGAPAEAGPDDTAGPQPRKYTNPWAELYCHSS